MYGSVFSVNRSSGELVMHGSVDHEQHSEYSLVVVARDGLDQYLSGAVRRSTRVQVTVRVTDVNDCAPHITVNSLSSRGLAEVGRVRTAACRSAVTALTVYINEVKAKFHYTSWFRVSE